MMFPNSGMPPSSIGGYIEDMLNELAELADRLKDSALAASIREASTAAARTNTKIWLENHRS